MTEPVSYLLTIDASAVRGRVRPRCESCDARPSSLAASASSCDGGVDVSVGRGDVAEGGGGGARGRGVAGLMGLANHRPR